MRRPSTETNKTAVLPHQPEPKEEQLSLFSPEAINAIRREAARWRREVHDPLTAKRGAWKKDFTTVSGMEVNPLATPTDIAVAFHLPTLYGYDSEHPASNGEVGKCGVAVDTLADMETIFDRINLED